MNLLAMYFSGKSPKAKVKTDPLKGTEISVMFREYYIISKNKSL